MVLKIIFPKWCNAEKDHPVCKRKISCKKERLDQQSYLQDELNSDGFQTEEEKKENVKQTCRNSVPLKTVTWRVFKSA